MIDIDECDLEGKISETAIFEIRGLYNREEFACTLELRLDMDPDDVDLDQVDYECIDGADLGPDGYDVLEELLDEVFETEAYQEAIDSYRKIKKDLDALFN